MAARAARRLLVVATLLAASLPAPSAAAATTYSDSVTGVEYAATSTEGRFAGTASGSLPGYWDAVVDHTQLSPNAVITGGTFSLSTILNGTATRIDGTFSSGTVTQTVAGAHCTNQQYAVQGVLAGVQGSGTGQLDVTLTHYRKRIFGHCVTYSAAVSGTVTLIF